MCDTTVKFSVLCSLFDAVTSTKKGPLKRKHIRTFLDRVYTDHEYFSALRLMLPSEDKQRSTFGLKETTLGKFLAEALCLSSDAVDAQKLVNWRKGGTRVGSNAGNFASIATEVLSSRQRVISTGLKIKDVNDLLDRLAAAGSKEKVPILQEIVNKTNSQEMKWIVMIILKDLKLGISHKTIFSEFHPDAEDLFNVTCDLKLVCEKLRNRNERYSRKDIEVGKAVRPQLASRIDNVEDAWMKLQGKKVTVECKFDGFRIQIHKDGTKFYFYSRNFNDLYEKCKHGIVDVLTQNVLPEKCILDGELVAWDRSKNSFVEFDKIMEVATAVRDGLETSQQLCYIAFDLLYYGSSSVIHLPLRERQELLCKVIRPVKRRLEVLNPYCGLGTQRSVGDSEWSIVAKSVEEVRHFFQRCVENRDEGVVVKDLDSKWQPGDRTGKWLKLKPDYVLGSDLDVLIIGGYYGSGRWGGHVAQFLLGIAEKPKAEEYPTMFSSFCKVGTGYNVEEREHLVQKLSPYFIRNEKNSKPPRCYKVTNHAKERPDVWVYPPDKSVILEVNSDIRTISTEVFAAPHGLRFPRVNKVRYEKPWYDCLDIQTLINMVRSEKGSAADLKGHRKLERKAPEHRKLKKARSNCLPLVPSHMSNTDVSHVEHTTKIFEKAVFYFVNYSAEQSKESLHKLVKENEGSVSMNLSNAVTHTIASEKKGIKFQAAAAHGDVIHFSWVIDCCTTKTLLPVSPKYFLHLSDQTKEKRKDDIDDYGDRYSLDIDVADLKQIFKNIDTAALSVDPDKLARAKKKYCSSSAFCQFSDCHFYFHKPIHSSNPDSQMVAETALKRQELEVSMHAGDVSKTLNANVTHMIVYTSSKQALPFRTIVKSMSSEEVKFLASDKLKIWSHRWIDEHMLGTCGHPMKDNYDLRDPSFQFNEDIVNQVKMGMRGKASG